MYEYITRMRVCSCYLLINMLYNIRDDTLNSKHSLSKKNTKDFENIYFIHFKVLTKIHFFK